VKGIEGRCDDDLGNYSDFKFDRSGERLLVWCKRVDVIELATGRSVTKPGPFGSVAMSGDGKRFVTRHTWSVTRGWNAGSTSVKSGTHTITAEYSGDTKFSASTGTLLNGQVVNAQPSLSINDVLTTEGDSGTKTLSFTVTLSSASSLPLTVNYQTADGTATAPGDYQAIGSTLLTFNPGETTKTINVTINGDQTFELDETFFVNLSDATNATIADKLFDLQRSLGVSDDVNGPFAPTKQFTTDILLSYLLHPGTAVYLGYNNGFSDLSLRGLPPQGAPNNSTSRLFFIKVSYLLRY